MDSQGVCRGETDDEEETTGKAKNRMPRRPVNAEK